MKVIRMPVSSMLVNSYFYFDENSKDAVIIDPGAEAEKLQNFIVENELKIHGILLTHGHFDHIGAVEEIRSFTKAPLYVHQEEKNLLMDPIKNESHTILRKDLALTADRLLSEDEIIAVGSSKLQVIFTPGHTPGGVCYYDETHQILFSGDTLFFESVGRADFSYACKEDLILSIRNKLFLLPEDVCVYPGHGQTTSIGHEMACNPYVHRNERD